MTRELRMLYVKYSGALKACLGPFFEADDLSEEKQGYIVSRLLAVLREEYVHKEYVSFRSVGAILSELYEKEGINVSYKSFLGPLDSVLGGIRMSSVYLALSRDDLLTSTFMYSLLTSIVSQFSKCLFISTEKEDSALVKELRSFELLAIGREKAGLTDSQMKEYLNVYCLPLDFMHLVHVITYQVEQLGVKVVFIDRIESVPVCKNFVSEEAKMLHFCYVLKNWAKKLDIAIVLSSLIHPSDSENTPTSYPDFYELSGYIDVMMKMEKSDKKQKDKVQVDITKNAYGEQVSVDLNLYRQNTNT